MITLQEYKSYKNITTNDYDAMINTAIPYAQDIIEKYIDRNIIKSTKYEWVDIGNLSNTELFLNDYPVTKVIYVGAPQSAFTITGITTNMTVVFDESGVSIYDNPFTSPNVFNYSNSTTLSLLKTNIETQIPTLTVNLSAPGDTPSRLIVPEQAFNNSQVYYAKKINVSFIILDNRTIEISQLNDYLGSYNLGGYICNKLIYIVYEAGYDIANVPKALKNICINMVGDIVDVLSKSSSNIKSQSVGDYSYTLFDINISGDIVNKYKNDLDVFRKKSI